MWTVVIAKKLKWWGRRKEVSVGFSRPKEHGRKFNRKVIGISSAF